MRARSVKMLMALVVVGSPMAACGSSGTAAVASVATASSTASDAAPTTAVAIVAGNDNSHGGGSSGGGGSGKNGGGSAAGSATGGTGTVSSGTADVIKVTKCWSNGPELLIKASSSDPSAQLNAYRPDGSLIGQVQNGGGSRYGGTAFGGQRSDPGEVTIKSSSGGSITVKTSPFQPEP